MPASASSRPPLPPPQPAYVLRGHATQVHAVAFLCANTRLLTADGDGWVVHWNIPSRRPAAVWKAHNGAVLGVAAWSSAPSSALSHLCPQPKVSRRRIITHGRDNKLLVWKLDVDDEALLDTALPVETSAGHRRCPWLIASLDVNALNFCAFTACERMPWHVSTGVGCGQKGGEGNEEMNEQRGKKGGNTKEREGQEDGGDGFPELLVAVPSALDSDAVDIMNLPSGMRAYARICQKAVKTGMAMALQLSYVNNHLTLLAGYESGHVVVHRLRRPSPSSSSFSSEESEWDTVYTQQPHTQPVLSLALSVNHAFFLSSSADALIVKHPLDVAGASGSVGTGKSKCKVLDTHHAGQQAVCLRGDGKIFAAAGWDGMVRIYSVKTMKALAVLKWHREGCYAVDFGKVGGEAVGEGTAVVVRSVGEMRERSVTERHWVAVGSKDGKVSLWQIY